MAKFARHKGYAVRSHVLRQDLADSPDFRVLWSLVWLG